MPGIFISEPALTTLGKGFVALARKRWILALLAIFAPPSVGAQAAPPNADLVQSTQHCENSGGRITEALRISACTELLNSAGYSAMQRAKVLTNRAWAYGQSGLWSQAQADYDAAIKLVPGWPIAHSDKGFALLRMGQFENAIASYDQALALDHHTVYALYGRGIARLRKHQTELGQQDLAMARQLMQNVDDVFARYGVTP